MNQNKTIEREEQIYHYKPIERERERQRERETERDRERETEGEVILMILQ